MTSFHPPWLIYIGVIYIGLQLLETFFLTWCTVSPSSWGALENSSLKLSSSSCSLVWSLLFAKIIWVEEPGWTYIAAKGLWPVKFQTFTSLVTHFNHECHPLPTDSLFFWYPSCAIQCFVAVVVFIYHLKLLCLKFLWKNVYQCSYISLLVFYL